MIIIVIIATLILAVVLGLINSIFPWIFLKISSMLFGGQQALVDKISNIDALIGRKAMVTAAIMPYSTGYVKIGGEVWLAKSQDNQLINTDQIVEVVSVSGCHVVVKATT